MTARHPVVGPDPAQLSDDDLLEAVGRLAALGHRVAGAPLSYDVVRHLDGYRHFIAGLLNMGIEVLRHECTRRIEADQLRVAAEVEAWLAAGGGDLDGFA